jgi:hypothetical protein
MPFYGARMSSTASFVLCNVQGMGNIASTCSLEIWTNTEEHGQTQTREGFPVLGERFRRAAPAPDHS